jgi:hypothetical protein
LYGYDEDNLASIITALVAMQKYSHEPMLLPFIFTEHMLQDSETFLRLLWDDFKVVHRSLDCNDYFAHQSHRRMLDLTDMPHKLTCLANATADSTSRNVAVKQKVEFIGSLVEKIQSPRPDMFVNELRNHILLMQQRCESFRSQNEYMKESLQSMMQMVRRWGCVSCTYF